MRTSAKERAFSDKLDRDILWLRAEDDVAGTWYSRAFDRQQREVLVALTYQMLIGGPRPPSLAKACAASAIPSATGRSWKHRSEPYAAAVDSIIARWTKPAPVQKAEPPSPPPGPTETDHRRLQDEVERARRNLQTERLRAKNRHYADVRRFEKHLERTERALYVFELARPSSPPHH